MAPRLLLFLAFSCLCGPLASCGEAGPAEGNGFLGKYLLDKEGQRELDRDLPQGYALNSETSGWLSSLLRSKSSFLIWFEFREDHTFTGRVLQNWKPVDTKEGTWRREGDNLTLVVERGDEVTRPWTVNCVARDGVIEILNDGKPVHTANLEM